MEIKGTIVHNLGIEKGTSKSSGKAWQKAAIVIETEGQYPKRILLTNFKDAENFAALQVSAKGTFHIEIESREWKNPNTGKVNYFTEVSCWKWEIEQAAVPRHNAPNVAGVPATANDDLPF